MTYNPIIEAMSAEVVRRVVGHGGGGRSRNLKGIQRSREKNITLFDCKNVAV